MLARPSRRRSFLFFLPIRIYAPLLALQLPFQSRPSRFSSAFFFRVIIPLSATRPTAHRCDNRKLKKLLPIDTWRCLARARSSRVSKKNNTRGWEASFARATRKKRRSLQIESDNDNAAGRFKIEDATENADVLTASCIFVIRAYLRRHVHRGRDPQQQQQQQQNAFLSTVQRVSISFEHHVYEQFPR